MVERLAPVNRIRALETALALAPLPLHASYWNYPANPVLKQAIQEAVAYARGYGAELAPRAEA